MSRSTFLLAVFVLSALPVFAAHAQPNIIVILADDLGWGDLSCYPKAAANPDAPMFTPNLDSLAAQGVKFTQAYAQTMCSPSRAAIMTGRFPQRFGFYSLPDANAGLPKTELTIAELLHREGYATACIGKWHIGHLAGYRPLDRGFDRFYGFLGAQHDYFKPSVGSENWGADHEGVHVYDQEEPVTKMKYLTDQLTDEAIEFIRGSGQAQKPFFLYLAYNAPHGPNQARPDILEEFKRMPAKSSGRTLARAMEDSLDTGVGRILRELFLSRLETNTVVIFASDNGGVEYESPTGELTTYTHNGGLRGTKFMTWEGGFRVPLIIRWPGRFPAGSTFEKPVDLVDIYATVAAAAGLAIPATRKLDGVDLLPFVTGQNSGTPHEVLHACNTRDGPQWSVRKGDWKLVKDYPDTSFFAAKPRPATILGLYDLSKDPWERKNLIHEHPEIAAGLRKLHDDFVASCPPSLGSDSPKGKTAKDEKEQATQK